MSNPWIERPFAIMGQTMDPWRLPTDPVQQVKIKRSFGFTVEHWFGCRFKTGGDSGRSYYFRTRHGTLEDCLGEYLQAAHAQDLRVLVYVNVHWFSNEFPASMLARNADGTAMGAYGNGAIVCPSGPFHQFAMELAEDLAEYPIDGAFLDGPCAAICWCESCRKEYRDKFGQDMPDGRLSLAQRRTLEHWTAEKVARFIHDFRQTLRRKRPEAIVYHNGGSVGHLTWTNRAAIKEADLLGIEGGFIGYAPLQAQLPYKTTATAKLLECLAEGKPTVVFNDHAFKVYDYYPLPRAELDLLWGATIAGGANPWFLMYASNYGTHAAQVAKDWNAFIKKHEQLLGNTRAVETAALLWSDSTHFISTSVKVEEDSVHAAGESAAATKPVPADHETAFWGAYAMLARSGIPFRLVTEKDLADGLGSELNLLIAPSVVALEEEAFRGLGKFVVAGGTLLADDAFALLDESGRPRNREMLQSLLGAVTTEALPVARDNIDYFHVSDSRWNAGLTPAPLPRPTRAYRTEARHAKPAAFLYHPLAGRYDDLTAVSDMPAILSNEVERGHVVFIPMNLFEHYKSFSFEDHRQMVDNILKTFHRPLVTVDGLCGRGEVLLRGKEGKLLVHLLNYNGGVRPFAGILPLPDISITVAAGTRVTAARALHAEAELAVSETGQTVRLPRLEVTETIVLDIQPDKTR